MATCFYSDSPMKSRAIVLLYKISYIRVSNALIQVRYTN